MRFAQLFVIDRLAYAVAAVLGEQAHLALRKMRGSVAWLHGITLQQPIRRLIEKRGFHRALCGQTSSVASLHRSKHPVDFRLR